MNDPQTAAYVTSRSAKRENKQSIRACVDLSPPFGADRRETLDAPRPIARDYDGWPGLIASHHSIAACKGASSSDDGFLNVVSERGNTSRTVEIGQERGSKGLRILFARARGVRSTVTQRLVCVRALEGTYPRDSSRISFRTTRGTIFVPQESGESDKTTLSANFGKCERCVFCLASFHCYLSERARFA